MRRNYVRSISERGGKGMRIDETYDSNSESLLKIAKEPGEIGRSSLNKKRDSTDGRSIEPSKSKKPPVLVEEKRSVLVNSGRDVGGQPIAGKQKTSLNVVEINRESVFSFDEAKAILPVIFRLTKSAADLVKDLLRELDGLDATSRVAQELEAKASQLIEEWQEKVRKLGGVPKGIWIVDFDAGNGYFCWKYPEPTLLYWHRYQDGFGRRVELSRSHLSDISRVQIETP